MLLAFVVGARLWDRATGLAAATLLAVTPWHLYLGRTGHEAGLAPLLFAAALAATLWVGLPLADGDPRPRPLRACLAGLFAGIACYGYPAVRLVLRPEDSRRQDPVHVIRDPVGRPLLLIHEEVL